MQFFELGEFCVFVCVWPLSAASIPNCSHTTVDLSDIEDIQKIERFAEGLDSSKTSLDSSHQEPTVSSSSSSLVGPKRKAIQSALVVAISRVFKMNKKKKSQRNGVVDKFRNHKDSFKLIRVLTDSQNKGYIPRQEHPLLREKLRKAAIDDWMHNNDCDDSSSLRSMPLTLNKKILYKYKQTDRNAL